MEKKIIQLGVMDEDGYELDNRVHSRGGISPTLRAGNAKIKVVKAWTRKSSLRGGCGEKWGRQYHQQDRVYDRKGIASLINAAGNNGMVIKVWKKR